MSTSQSSPQSAVARRSAEAELRSLITTFAPAHRRLVAATRRSLRARLPTAHEMVYEYRDCFVISYSPDGRGNESVLAIRGSADGVRLYVNRREGLPDPERLLQGSGKQARWIQLESAATIARPAVACLMEEAIARSPAPFSETGGGSTVIRPGAARLRRTAGR